ncbi:adenosylcobinamide kinase/adenosylcobinamide-phosphate guanylyltransferase [Evansella vedderi]|uniref:Adenosylcobinamide kinase/adenosylcobinamide-phosphate guanylyltransferase n=1 Tax=Evansella vedderi TaxID=38282 RepID=A0ABU0A0X1_9BACI|nr:bifunctional adenosylcobinamide kinase/adenosylcobinamide-phosphate guanylyltransferase [Evansella vedderi]MDQ0256358.1 adenosylcobinamide kinase/adenosylcobinamide-phosphate guanylyltransferase [Evansella vedderi]
MQLIVGGAYAGKRKIVKSNYKKCSWLSAYKGHSLKDWKSQWEVNTTLVLEGWEKWIEEELKEETDDLVIRNRLQKMVHQLKEEEQKRNETIVLIMLELGRGIVPLKQKERNMRDLAGWLLQDAVQVSNDVQYVWHGMSRKIK